MKDRIKQIRQKAGLTQTQFGAACGGKSLSSVQKWEMGYNQPDNSTIALICQKFGVNESWLRNGEGDMPISQSREQEMAALVRSLMEDSPESFRSALVTTLLRFDPNGPEWEILERIYDGIAKNRNPGE